MKRSVVISCVVLLWVGGNVHAQTTASEWTVPRTADGKPNLQGFWTSQTYTPLERPVRFADREFLTEEEIWNVILFLYDYTGQRPRAKEEHQ